MAGVRDRLRKLAEMVENEWPGEYSIGHAGNGHIEITFRKGDRAKRLLAATTTNNSRTDLNIRTRIRRAAREMK